MESNCSDTALIELVACDGVHVTVPLKVVNTHMPVVADIVEDLDVSTVPLVGLDGIATGKRVQLIVNALTTEGDVFEEIVMSTFEERSALFQLLEYLDVEVLKERAALAVAQRLTLQPWLVSEMLIDTRTPANASLARGPAFASPLPGAP